MAKQRPVQFVSHGVQNQQASEQYTPEQPTGLNDSMEEDHDMNEVSEQKPSWMKKMQGVKRISNKERRRRQNQNLRKLLTPKSALMVLNEIMPGEQLVFKVEPVQDKQFYKSTDTCFCAEVTVEGKTFKGVGETKANARHAAAELAIRELIISRLSRLQDQQAASNAAATAANAAADATGEEGMECAEEEPMPMIQLASFALHKLFSEWEGTGLRVPHFRPSAASVSSEAECGSASGGAAGARGAKAAKQRSEVPSGAGAMHPCMLLTYMRPRTLYRVLACTGDRPQNYEYKMAIDVDGATFVGTGKNKKEARKQAAIAACTSLFGVTFDQ
ncbi:double-stranded RNA-specific editase B2-like isoform X2 [Zerene cesonia]|nr:double-stranded RNA-specific editase B2-like isoform X2 [Zerene cesonia]